MKEIGCDNSVAGTIVLTEVAGAMWPQVLRLIVPVGTAVALVAWLTTRGVIKFEHPAVALRWKRLFVACWVVGMTGILALTLLVYGNHPTKPDVETHRIYSYNLHGTRIYLTEEEKSALTFFEGMGGFGMLAGLGVGFLMQRQKQRTENQKSVRPDL